MNDHCSHNCCHQTSADEESIPILEGGARLKFEDEVMIDPRVLPHEKVASVHEQVQA